MGRMLTYYIKKNYTLFKDLSSDPKPISEGPIWEDIVIILKISERFETLHRMPSLDPFRFRPSFFLDFQEILEIQESEIDTVRHDRYEIAINSKVRFEFSK